MRPKVFVSQPIPEPALDMLREVAEVTVFPRLDRNMSEDEWIMAAQRADYLFVMGGNIITTNVIKANPKLKGIAMVHRRLPVNNSIDLDTAKALGVPVVFQYPWEPVYDRIAEATCDLTIAMILDLAYRLIDADRYTRSGRTLQEHTMALMGPGVTGKIAGLLGLGKVALKMVPRLRALRMSVLYTKRTRLAPAQERELGVEWADQSDILRRSDFVCLEYDYNPSTHKMIGEREFALMKPTAYFINTARGRIVDEPALVRALQNRTIAGAGLDVFWHEPPGSPEMAPSEEFFKMDNVILAPHNGGATWDARTELTKATARQIVTLIGGGRPEGLVLD